VEVARNAIGIIQNRCAGCHTFGDSNGDFRSLIILSGNQIDVAASNAAWKASRFIASPSNSASTLLSNGLRKFGGNMPPNPDLTSIESDAVKAWAENLKALPNN